MSFWKTKKKCKIQLMTMFGTLKVMTPKTLAKYLWDTIGYKQTGSTGGRG